ncbi:DUF4349 domain-containing protein [Amycolatopsis panacis]|uniref:DUF4349 domain-containing protein n=1 Tax=Amycolatopsis panacis TaxID=2340917 RepID=A0A419I1B3_9PSEU|nr:DUF4349 domain-containing protein [Amycolatopsis panacis]RJQ83470.1 DUF4349 domain-containing protein [Amycolatopsis panacis]
MRTRWRSLLAGGGLVLVLSGCSGTQETATPAQAGMAANAGAAPKQEAVPGPKAAPAQVSPSTTDRKLARSARLDVTTRTVADVVARARAIAADVGGYPGQETSTTDSATVSLSVPAEKLDPVLDRLAGLGEVTRRELSTRDVTGQVVDVAARLATQRASVDRIRALLAKASSVSEIASVESELTSREAELESLERQQDSLAGTVAMATVALSVTGTAAPQAADESGGFLGGLGAGWRGFLVFGGAVLRVLGAVVPFAVVLGIPAGALLWWLRRRRRVRVAETPAE